MPEFGGGSFGRFAMVPLQGRQNGHLLDFGERRGAVDRRLFCPALQGRSAARSHRSGQRSAPVRPIHQLADVAGPIIGGGGSPPPRRERTKGRPMRTESFPAK